MWLFFSFLRSFRFFFLYVYNRKSQRNYVNPKVLAAVKSNDGAQDNVQKKREWRGEIAPTSMNVDVIMKSDVYQNVFLCI